LVKILINVLFELLLIQWERMTREEAVNIPIGLTEAQKEHIFGKDTNK
jgi:hypothetical protein